MLGTSTEKPNKPKICDEKIPSITQSAASIADPIIMSFGDSLASSASCERGNARKVTPKAFTKHAAASALVRAKTAKASRRRSSRNGFDRTEDWRRFGIS
jgi:hypothetical protein